VGHLTRTKSYPTMNGLNCVKGHVPSSLSLHSVGVRPIEFEPGLVAITVRAGSQTTAPNSSPIRAEVRVVHGSEDVHAAVREAVLDCFGTEGGAEEEGLDLGYWAFRVANTLQVEKERSKFLLTLFGRLTCQSWDVVASSNLTPGQETDQVMEAFTWIVKKNVNTPPSSDCCLLVVGEKQVEVVSITGESILAVNNTVRNVIDSVEEKAVTKSKPSESGYISEEDKKDSKSSSVDKIDAIGEAREDKGKEGAEEELLASPDKKESPASPDMLAEIEHEIRKSMENLLETNEKADCKNITIEVESEAESKETTIETNVASNQNTKDDNEGSEESKEPKSPTKSKDGSPKKNLEVQKSKSLLANLFGNRPLSPNVGKLVQDDPNCPAILPLPEDCLSQGCGLLVDLLHQLLCRQWKAVTSVKTEEGNSLFFLRHDPRILPGLGQQSLAGFSLNSQGAIHLHNASQEIVESVKLFADATNLGEKLSDFCLKDELPLSKGRELLTEIMSVFNNYNFALYSSIELGIGGRHTNLLLFRPSTVQASAFLGLTLGQGNLLTLDGGAQEEIDGVREILSSRWPYPIATDMAVSASCWSWKVKRYPWRMSYGNKLVDRAVDRASKIVRQLSFPPPNNHDLESAKSLLVCLMRELSERGWKFVGAHNLHSSKCLLHFSK